MNYAEVVDLSLSYADREDEEVTSRVDSFMRIVEARVNRKLRVFEMSIRATIPAEADQSYYGLPPDFGGLRDIQMSIPGTDPSNPISGQTTLSYMSPEQINNQQSLSTVGNPGTKIYYTLIAQQLQIWPPQSTGDLEIIYYQKIVPLTGTNPINWLSENDPDAYVFGILVEINSFVKDANASALWDDRFVNVVDEIYKEDQENRWSGTALETRVG